MSCFFTFGFACLLGVPAAPQSNHETHTVKLSGPLVREIEGDVLAAQLSPDGSRAVYRASASMERTRLFSVPTDGGEPPVQLSEDPSHVSDFRISADGAWVVYADGVLYSVPIDGSLPPLPIGAGVP